MKFAVSILLFVCIIGAAFSVQTVQANPNHPDMLTPDAPQGIPPLGEPGLSWHFAENFGQLYTPYLDEPYHLNSPHGIAAVGNTVWVTERLAKRALQFSSDGAALTQIGRAMNGVPWVLAEIPYLCDVAVAADNNVWLSYRNRIYKANLAGEMLYGLSGGPAMSYGCLSLATDASDRLYVSDPESNRITIYDTAGNYLKTVGEGDDDPLSLLYPQQLALAGNWLYVADSDNNRIVIIDASDFDHFQVAEQIQDYLAGGQPADFNQPTGVAVDAMRIFVVDSQNHRVQVFDRNTLEYLVTMGDGGRGTGNNQWDLPYDVALDASGNIYVSDENNHRVQQFAPNLTYRRTFGQTQVPYLTDEHYINQPRAVQADSQGNIYVTESSAHRIIKLSSDGSPLFSLGQAGISGDDVSHFSFPAGLGIDALDRLYVADAENNRIMVFNSTGSYVSQFGSYGSENDQFDSPSDVAISPVNGDIIVADLDNQRVQVFSFDWTFKRTIGVTGVSGTDDTHFDRPRNIAVGASGAIYVLDTGPVQRVQKCVLTEFSFSCTNLTGKSGDGIDDYEEFLTMLSGLGVDANERVYLPTFGPASVVIYDINGNFVGMVAGGPLPTDVTFDPSGNLYLSSSYAHIVTKMTPGVTDWQPVNVTAFGDIDLMGNPLLVTYDGALVSGHPSPLGAQVWRLDSLGEWSTIALPGIGDPLNTSITSGVVFDQNLYLGTENIKDESGILTGGAVYRYDGTTWSSVASGGMGTPTNFAISSLAEFGGAIFAGTSRADNSDDPATPLGAHIYRSPSGDDGSWVKVLDFSTLVPASPNNSVLKDLQVFNGYLYAAVGNSLEGSELWRTNNGIDWVMVFDNGLGLGGHGSFTSLEPLGSYLYVAGSAGPTGARIYRCQQCDTPADFAQVVLAGFDYQDLDGNGLFDNTHVQTLLAYSGTLYAWTQNEAVGNLTWRTRDGLYWEQTTADDYDTAPGGFGQLVNSAAVVDGKLYLGLERGCIWQMKPRLEVFKTGGGSGTVTSVPAGIDCGPVCSARFPEASSVTLTATPAAGSQFSGWDGEGCSGMGDCTVSIDRIRTVSAEFTALPSTYSLSVQKPGDGAGLVASNPPGVDCGADCQYNFPSGTVVNLSAVAERGTFTGWSGDCTGTGVCLVTLSEARHVAATFTQHAPLVSGFNRNGVADNPILFTSSDFATHFSDIDGDSLVKVQITTLPSHGVLWLGGFALNVNQVVSYSQLSSLFYRPNSGYLGDDTFTWNGSDGLAYAAAPAQIVLSVLQDDDGDAVGSQIEAAVPPLNADGIAGDGNGDDLEDAIQANVASLLAGGTVSTLKNEVAQLAGMEYITLAVPSLSELHHVYPMPYPASNPAPLTHLELYPTGFVQLEIDAVPGDGGIDLQLYYAAAGCPDTVYAFGPTPGSVLPHWYEFLYDSRTGAECTQLPNDKIQITLHYQDGERGDSDLTANGVINPLFGPVVITKNVYLPMTVR